MNSMLSTCLNWKVLVAAGVLAAAVLVFAPDLAGAALPLLLLAICPLSMIVMLVVMRGVRGSKRDAEEQPQPEAQLTALPMSTISNLTPPEAKR
jgi:membrane protein implicated in regulation of membrane protease activity